MMINKLTHEESIKGLNSTTLSDFWSWAYSDVLNNMVRSVFAEWLVAIALGVTDKPRVEWDAVDLRFQGKGIEVKSSAYLQSWEQSKLSNIVFDIAKKTGWDAETNTYTPEPTRSSDCYVFCLFAEKDPTKADVLDVGQWRFWVISTKTINEVFSDQKSVALSRLQKFSSELTYDLLQKAVIETFQS